ncbi:MAG: aminotransferase class IV [Planctomycetota bacterium]
MKVDYRDSSGSADPWVEHVCRFHCSAIACDEWIPYRQLFLSVDDIGFRQGVTAVERLRTYGGRPFEVDAHLERLRSTIDHLRIDGLPDSASFAAVLDELLERNQPLIQASRDVGITIWATPGPATGRRTPQPTWSMHLNRLDLERIQRSWEHGQTIVVTDVQQPSSASWSRQAKVRCRLHYYLADQQARDVANDSTGALIDHDGSVTETSIANIAVVINGTIRSPPAEQVLTGITQQVIERLAAEVGVPWVRRRLTFEEMKIADEVILMGTDIGLWCGNRIIRSSYGGLETVISKSVEKIPGRVVRTLQNRFAKLAGLLT